MKIDTKEKYEAKHRRIVHKNRNRVRNADVKGDNGTLTAMEPKHHLRFQSIFDIFPPLRKTTV